MDSYNYKKIILKRIGIIMLALIGISALLVILFYIVSEQMGTLVFALLIGGMGSCISFFLRIPKLGDTELGFIVTSWWALIVPALVGTIMGGFIYIVFFAGILTGDGGNGLFTSNLFPLFTEPTLSEGETLTMKTALQIRPATIQDLGKLLVWCFLAGYSERLVPNILQGLEDRGVSTGKKD